MADYYLQFSEKIEIRSDAERQWLIGQTDIAQLEAEQLRINPIKNKGLWKKAIEASPFVLLWHFIENENIPFSHAFEESQWWIYAQECGDLGAATELVQAFFLQFRPEGEFTLTWTESCSKPRQGEFAGGACIVTAQSIEMMRAHQWLEMRRAASARRWNKSHSKSR